MVARLSVNWYKTFAAISKKYFYVNYRINSEVIDEIADEPFMTDTLLADTKEDGYYASRYGLFPQAPLFHRMRWMLRKNANNAAYPEKFKYIAADEATPPPEAFWDRTSDPWGVDNLLYSRSYTVVEGTTMQPWGNNVEKVTLSYGEYSESRLSPDQKAALAKMRVETKAWVDNENNYMDWDFNFEDRW